MFENNLQNVVYPYDFYFTKIPCFQKIIYEGLLSSDYGNRVSTDKIKMTII